MNYTLAVHLPGDMGKLQASYAAHTGGFLFFSRPNQIDEPWSADLEEWVLARAGALIDHAVTLIINGLPTILIGPGADPRPIEQRLKELRS